MHQILIESTGEPASVARLHETSPPPLPAGHVRLRMLYAPINPADLNFIEGTYGKKPNLPCVPGIEGVGRIIESPDATTHPPGRLAIPLAGPGCWSGEVVLPVDQVFVLPDGIDPVQAAMLRVNPATAHGLLHADGAPRPGSWVALNAASSGAGHCVIQLAHHLGLRTLNFVRRPESAPACEALGADAVFTDAAESVAAARALSGFEPPSLALNAVGGDSAIRLMDLLAPGGMMTTYGAMARQPVKVPNGFLIFKGVRLHGFWLTRWLESVPAAEIRALYDSLAGLVAGGIIKQPVAAVYPLTEINEALRHAAASARGGKVILAL